MPWPPKQATAIFLSIKRKKGERAAVDFMHKHGYPKDSHLRRAARSGHGRRKHGR